MGELLSSLYTVLQWQNILLMLNWDRHWSGSGGFARDRGGPGDGLAHSSDLEDGRTTGLYFAYLHLCNVKIRRLPDSHPFQYPR